MDRCNEIATTIDDSIELLKKKNYSGAQILMESAKRKTILLNNELEKDKK